MIRVGRPLWLIAAVLAALPWTRPLGLVLGSLLLHEWAHVFTAAWCGAKVEPFYLRVAGAATRVRRMDNLTPRLRLCVYAAGPVVNLLLVAWAVTVHQLSYVGVLWLRDLAFYNAVLAGINLLPILPLDGGRLMQHFLGNRVGILRCNRFMLRMGRVAAILLMLLGFVQITLLSYNPTLLLAAVFMWRKNMSMAPPLRAECMMTLLKKPSVLLKKRHKPSDKEKHIRARPNMTVSRALERLTWSRFCVFHVKNQAGETIIVREAELLSYLFAPMQRDIAAVLAAPLATVKDRHEVVMTV
ncbi:MAG: hypothetical protein FWC71_11115 [Defluviitaleaceae bacterium]|nr:hypothetical protein [Defluviitaleaceae bacterium]